MYLRINSPNVVREFFDGEVVVVNLESGSYYSLENVASIIWLLFEQQQSADEIVTQLSRHYKMDSGHLRISFDKFIGQLISEKLVVVEQKAGERFGNRDVSEIVNNASANFTEPTARKYNDMQDLLLLDPIHDVDEAGLRHVAHRLQEHRAGRQMIEQTGASR